MSSVGVRWKRALKYPRVCTRYVTLVEGECRATHTQPCLLPLTLNMSALKNSATKSYENIKINLHDEVLNSCNGEKLVGAIDQGTSSTRFMVFTQSGRTLALAQMEHTQFFPKGVDKVGWHEHDPLEIFRNTMHCIEAVADAMEAKHSKLKLASIGITNQRETTIAWNKVTGRPYYNAIVWDDTRTTHIAYQIADGDINRLREKSGLPLASYFAGTKVKWLLDNVYELQADLKNAPEQVCFGTVDTWLIYQLTGTKSDDEGAINCGGRVATDATNASRWLFMNLNTQKWDTELINTVCFPHKLPLSVLPEICPSSYLYATCRSECGVNVLEDVPIGAVFGDQQAALFGQTAFTAGEAKNTYGTGLFLMMNTGTRAIPSTHGLITTVAYKIGSGPTHFALEGSVSHSGSTIQWLRDQLEIIESASESEELATSCNDGLYFVPAFSGLFAPHWNSTARACIVGMTASHHKGHICRAALEAAAYQTLEVFEAIAADSQVELKSLKVDGGGTNNRMMMQFQADIINVPVIKPKVMETTSIGAAFAAGLTVGVWKDLEEIKHLWSIDECFEPKMNMRERKNNISGWQKAISRSLDWVEEEEDFVDAVAATSIDKVKLFQKDCSDVLNPSERYKPSFRLSSMLLGAFAHLVVGYFIGRSTVNHRRK